MEIRLAVSENKYVEGHVIPIMRPFYCLCRY